MDRLEFLKKTSLGLGGVILLPACQKNLEFSPYENVIDDPKYKDNNAKNISLLSDLGGNQEFSFAIVADTHNYYDEFNDAVKHINANRDVKFVIHAGDLTNRGFQKEYILTQDIMARFNVPQIAVIGNHEYFEQNGTSLFRTVYGPRDFSFVVDNRKFIFFDNNLDVNSDITFGWLDREINDGIEYTAIFVITHAPPHSFTFGGKPQEREEFEAVVTQPRVTMTIYGHEHYYYYDDEKRYLLVDYIKKKNYNIVTARTDGTYEMERVYY